MVGIVAAVRVEPGGVGVGGGIAVGRGGVQEHPPAGGQCRAGEFASAVGVLALVGPPSAGAPSGARDPDRGSRSTASQKLAAGDGLHAGAGARHRTGGPGPLVEAYTSVRGDPSAQRATESPTSARPCRPRWLARSRTAVAHRAGRESVRGGFGRLYPLRLVEIGFPAEPLAWFTGLNVLVLLVGAVVLRLVEARVHDVRAGRSAYVLGCLAGTAGLVVLSLAPDPVSGAAAVVLVAGTTDPIARTISTIWANERAEREVRATVHSFLAQSEYVGEILCGAVLVAIAATAGMSAALLSCAGLFAVTALLVWRAGGERGGSVARAGRGERGRAGTRPGVCQPRASSASRISRVRVRSDRSAAPAASMSRSRTASKIPACSSHAVARCAGSTSGASSKIVSCEQSRPSAETIAPLWLAVHPSPDRPRQLITARAPACGPVRPGAGRDRCG
jgi:hypothetical protein